MQDLIVEATYVGAEGSYGYKKGKRYRLRVSRDTVSRMLGGGGALPYSVQGFLMNWTDIVALGKTPRLPSNT